MVFKIVIGFVYSLYSCAGGNLYDVEVYDKCLLHVVE